MVKSISKIKLEKLLNSKKSNDMIFVTGVTIGMSVREAKTMFNNYDGFEFYDYRENEDGSVEFRMLDAEIKVEDIKVGNL